MKHLDLFSGIGGFALAASWVWGAEHEIVSFVEIDTFCQKVLRKHWPGVQIHPDIKDYEHDGTAIDLVTGGPPCQATSVAAAIQGKRTGESLYGEMAKVVLLVRPKWVIVEQPAGNKKWETEVALSLEGAGYTVTKLERQALYCGAPHKRKRVFYVANSTGKRGFKGCRGGKPPEAIENAWPSPPRGAWRSARTGYCGMDNGIPDWVDRIKSLGNAIVPQVVVPIMEEIKTVEEKG